MKNDLIKSQDPVQPVTVIATATAVPIAQPLPNQQQQQQQQQQYSNNNVPSEEPYGFIRRRIPGYYALINVLVSFIVFICCIIACFDWYWIYVSTNGSTCIASDPSLCTEENPSCNMKLKIFLNYGTCFSNSWSRDPRCQGWRPDTDFYTSIANSTNTDVDYEARNVFFETWRNRMSGGAFVGAFFSLLLGPFLAAEACMKVFIRNATQMNRFLISCVAMMLLQLPIISNLSVAIKDLGINDDSHALMNPKTWMDYIDNGNKIVPDCDDPTIYRYNWSPSDSQTGPAFKSALVALILSSCLAFFNLLSFLYVYAVKNLKDNNDNINVENSSSV